MTSIGILGTGRVGTNLAAKLAATGHHVILGHRSQAEQSAPERLAGPTRDVDSRISHADQRTAARTSEIVINATPGDSALDRLTGLRTELAGKILIDVANATHDVDGLPGDLCYPGSSLAERLQAALPDTRVVKTLNTMLFMVMTAPTSWPRHRPFMSRATTRRRRRPSPACSATWAGDLHGSRTWGTSPQPAPLRP